MIILSMICTGIVLICAFFLYHNYCKVCKQLEKFETKSAKEKEVFSLLGIKGGRLNERI